MAEGEAVSRARRVRIAGKRRGRKFVRSLARSLGVPVLRGRAPSEWSLSAMVMRRDVRRYEDARQLMREFMEDTTRRILDGTTLSYSQARVRLEAISRPWIDLLLRAEECSAGPIVVCGRAAR